MLQLLVFCPRGSAGGCLGAGSGAVGTGWLPPPGLFRGPPARLQSAPRGIESWLAALGSVLVLEVIAKIISFSASAAGRQQSIVGREVN